MIPIFETLISIRWKRHIFFEDLVYSGFSYFSKKNLSNLPGATRRISTTFSQKKHYKIFRCYALDFHAFPRQTVTSWIFWRYATDCHILWKTGCFSGAMRQKITHTKSRCYAAGIVVFNPLEKSGAARRVFGFSYERVTAGPKQVAVFLYSHFAIILTPGVVPQKQVKSKKGMKWKIKK